MTVPSIRPVSRVEAWRRVAFLASACAAAIHLGAVHSHLMEWTPAGAFMLVLGILQLVWALWVALGAPIQVIAAGAAGNAAIIGLWVWSRTAGLPYGPMAGMREHVHSTDGLATALELLVVVAAFAMTRPAGARPGASLRRLTAAGVFFTVLVTSHEPVRERPIAFAVLALAIVARFVAGALKESLVSVLSGGGVMLRRRSFAIVLLGSMLLMLAPVVSQAATRTPRGDIKIEWNGELDRSHGIRSGHGTPSDPYIISGWTVGNISIRDTDKAIKVVDNTITGTLRLNWIGSDLEVHHNDIGDLRLNENTARWGDPTSGHIMHNTFGTVGQLRHFDGMFSYNTVGAPETGMLGETTYPKTRGVNFDGFNGARFDHNTIYGYVDARLHGHHHSSAFGQGSHMHAVGPHSMPVDHTKRYHEVFIEANKIMTSNTYALSYLDTNHAANDRTANSETNPYLNAPHVHYTRVHLVGNNLLGAGILVDVFNAKDERHKGTSRGTMNVVNNRVTLSRDVTKPNKVLQGIEVRQARDVTLRIVKNVIAGAPPVVDVAPVRTLTVKGAAIFIHSMDKSVVWIDADRVSDWQFGVHAVQLTKTVKWTIRGLTTTGVAQPVMYDSSVANAPARR